MKIRLLGLRGYLNNCAGIAVAELRSLRRSTRTHVIIVLAFSAGLLFVSYAFFSHYGHSHVSPSAGGLNPRFLAHSFGFVVLCVLLFGTVFLGFDLRSRDAHAQIVEVFDVRAFSNFELLFGKLIAVVLTAWLPLLVFAVLLHVGGTIANELWVIGEPLEPMSTAILLFVDAPSALVLWCSVIMLLAVTLRTRIIVVITSLSLLCVWIWCLFKTPLHLLPATSVFGNVGTFGSDILPESVRPRDYLRLISVLTLAVGIVLVAAALHPRLDSALKFRRLVVGTTVSLMGFVGIGFLLIESFRNVATREMWSSVHAGLRDHPRP